MLDRSSLLASLPYLRKYALKLFRGRDGWEDLVQETICHALPRLHLYEPMEGIPLHSWLGVMMHNLFVNHWRKEASFTEGINLYKQVGVKPNPIINERVMDLAYNLSQLSPEHQAILREAAWGSDYQEMSSRLQLPIGTVRSRLARARVHLKEIEESISPRGRP